MHKIYLRQALMHVWVQSFISFINNTFISIVFVFLGHPACIQNVLLEFECQSTLLNPQVHKSLTY